MYELLFCLDGSIQNIHLTLNSEAIPDSSGDCQRVQRVSDIELVWQHAQ